MIESTSNWGHLENLALLLDASFDNHFHANFSYRFPKETTREKVLTTVVQISRAQLIIVSHPLQDIL